MSIRWAECLTLRSQDAEKPPEQLSRLNLLSTFSIQLSRNVGYGGLGGASRRKNCGV